MDKKQWTQALNRPQTKKAQADWVNDPDLFSYLETAMWSSTVSGEDPNNDDSMDEAYGFEDLDQSVIDAAKKDLEAFFDKAADFLDDGDGNIPTNWPHDFWLTRNGHGAGFWDGDYENGDKLAEIAEEFGEVDLYVGDDGKIYQSQ